MLIPTFAEIVSMAEAGFVVIDVPIGLSDEDRTCDRLARERLGERHVCVFTPPSRSALVAETQEEASRLNAIACGRGVSAQAFGIFKKISEVDAAMTKALQEHVFEAHPEVTFAELAKTDGGLEAGKDTPEGQHVRLALLRPFFELRETIAEARTRLGGRELVNPDDVVDALGCLATAIRLDRGSAALFPPTLEVDSRNLRMQIVA